MTVRTIILITALIPAIALAGCFGGDDDEAPGASNPTPPADDPMGNETAPDDTTNGTEPDDMEPPAPAGTPVNDTQTLTIQSPGPTGGGTPITSAAYKITPGFTSFSVSMKWYEDANGNEVGGVGEIAVDLIGPDGEPMGVSANLGGVGADPSTAELSVGSVPEEGDYLLRVTPSDPGATGKLLYTIIVEY